MRHPPSPARTGVRRAGSHGEVCGTHAIQPAVMLGMGAKIPDRISFGSIKDLTEFLFHTTETDDLDDGFL